jgi:hypothetical protein
MEGGLRVEWQWQVPEDAPHPIARPNTTEVTTEVDRLAAALSGEMTRRDLQTALGLKNDEHFRKTYLLLALDAGVIEMTIPDKPNSRPQKCRLAPKASGRRPRGVRRR